MSFRLSQKLPLIGAASAALACGYYGHRAYEYINVHLATRHSADHLEVKLQGLPLVKKLTATTSEYKLVRPWEYIKEEDRTALFTCGALSVPGAIGVPPVVFVDEKSKSTITIIHCGNLLAGFPFLAHGGLLGTALDEAIHRTAALSLGHYPRDNLSIKLSYKRPTLVHQFLVLRANTVDDGSGKLHVDATIETLKGKVLVQGSGWFNGASTKSKDQSFSWQSMIQ